MNKPKLRVAAAVVAGLLACNAQGQGSELKLVEATDSRYAQATQWLVKNKDGQGVSHDSFPLFASATRRNPVVEPTTPPPPAFLSSNDVPRPDLVRVFPVGSNINTINAESAPFRYGDKIYFAAPWKANDQSASVSRIFSVIKHYTAVLIPENTDLSELHMPQITLTPDGKRMYYTICEQKQDTSALRCRIFYREREYEGHWSVPKRLDGNINAESYSSFHPTVGYDKALGKEVLFFASDRPGGKGGLDIWASIIERGDQFGEPFLLPFNSPFDDVTPFFHQASQTLFFSSDRTGGLGGFDILSAKKKGKSAWTEPENPGSPLNSPKDDLYFTFNTGARKGYLASNRPGVVCEDDNGDCEHTDIFEARTFTDLTISVLNGLDSSELPGASLRLIDRATGKTDTLLEQIPGNKITIPLKLERNYLLNITQDGFVTASLKLSTEGVTLPVRYQRAVLLQPVSESKPVARLSVQDSLLLSRAGIQFGILGQSQPVVQTGVNEISDATAGKAIVGTLKTVLLTDSLIVSSFGAERQGVMVAAEEDSELPLFSQLPLTLYFDNDQPRYVKAGDTLTAVTYEQLYDKFVGRKNDYLTGYAAGLDGSEAEYAELVVKSFFEEEVEKSFKEFQFLCQILRQHLEAGRVLEIELVGFASPLSNLEYNKRLTGRRLSSIINYIEEYDDKALESYIKSGKLTFRQRSAGEGISTSKYVSDSTNDRKKSVFSPAASMLRSVTIQSVQSQPGK